MHRTQIYLNDDEYEALRKEAFNKHCSISELIRDAIDSEFLEESKHKAVNLKGIIGMFKDEKTDVSKKS